MNNPNRERQKEDRQKNAKTMNEWADAFGRLALKVRRLGKAYQRLDPDNPKDQIEGYVIDNSVMSLEIPSHITTAVDRLDSMFAVIESEQHLINITDDVDEYLDGLDQRGREAAAALALSERENDREEATPGGDAVAPSEAPESDNQADRD